MTNDEIIEFVNNPILCYEGEEWYSHPYLEDLEGSTFGRLRLKERHTESMWARGNNPPQLVTRTWKPKIIQQQKAFKYLNAPYKHKSHFSHRLLAEIFHPNPYGLPYVNHKDENKYNNRPENLEWCTQEYNANYGTAKERLGVILTNRTDLSKKVFQYTTDGTFITTYPSTMEVYRQLGYSYQQISSCCLGKCQTAYGYIWCYE